jgi:hypothetical protein
VPVRSAHVRRVLLASCLLAASIVLGAPSPAGAAVGDRVTVSSARGRFADVLATTRAAADRLGAEVTVVRTGTLDLTSVRRPNVTAPVQQARDGWGYPIAVAATDAEAAASTIGPGVADVLQAGQVLLNTRSAAIRGARAGDVMRFIGPTGRAFEVTIGFVTKQDASTEHTEMLMSTALADRIGFTRQSYAVVYDIPGRDSTVDALEDAAPRGAPVRVRGSWQSRPADTVLNQAQLKALLGEFAIYRSDPLRPDAAWTAEHIVTEEVPIIGRITCHEALMGPIRSALREVRDRGLAELINARDSRTVGGCYNARVLVTTGGASNTLSRHAWGAALDINPTANPFGARPVMDERIVEIFRRNGFAWGGTWLVPDGMHFEYVGEPRA